MLKSSKILNYDFDYVQGNISKIYNGWLWHEEWIWNFDFDSAQLSGAFAIEWENL